MNRLLTNLLFSAFLIFGSIFCIHNFQKSKIPVSSPSQESKIGDYKILRVISPDNNAAQKQFPTFVVPLAICEGISGQYWIATITGVYTYSEGKDEWKKVSSSDKNASPLGADVICQTDDKKLWIRSFPDRFIWVYDDKSWNKVETLSPNFTPIFPRNIFRGSKGKSWIALKDGIFVYDDEGWKLAISQPHKSQRIALSLNYKDKFSQSLTEKKRGLVESVISESLDAPNISNLGDVSTGIEDREGFIWLGTGRSLIKVNPSNSEWTIFSLQSLMGEVSQIYEDSDGKIWMATVRGDILAYNKSDDKWDAYSLTEILEQSPQPSPVDFRINGICEADNNKMIFATYRGLVVLKESERRWEVYTPHNSDLPNENITAIMKDNKGRIWLGAAENIIVLEE